MARPFRAPAGPRGYVAAPGSGTRGFRAASGPTGPGAREESLDPLLDSATSAADQFVKDYYEATNAHRHNLASYYLSSTAIAGSESPISIVFNGIEVPDGKAAQEIFEKSVPRSQIEVDTIDCQILNPNHSPAANASQHPKSAAKSCSILVIVGGIFKASDDRNEEEEDFNDSLIIVPNPEPPPPRPTRGPRYKDYLIQTQNFRLVSGDALDNDGIKMTE